MRTDAAFEAAPTTPQPRPENSAARGRGRRPRHVPWALLSAAMALGLWVFLSEVVGVATYILPTPWAVAQRSAERWQQLLEASLVSLGGVFVGLGVAIVAAVLLALLMTAMDVFSKLVYPLLVFAQTIPKVAIAPLFLLWFGFGPMSRIVTVALMCFFPILVDLLVGLRSADSDRVDLIKSMGGKRWAVLQFVRIPVALSHFFAGLKVATTLAFVGAVVAEFVGSGDGLGFLLIRAGANFDNALLFGVLVVLSILGYVVFQLVCLLERLLIPWHVSQRTGSSVDGSLRAA